VVANDAAVFNHPGVSIFASSGDSGSAAGAQYPASSFYVTAVGGTVLTKAANPAAGRRALEQRRLGMQSIHRQALVAT